MSQVEFVVANFFVSLLSSTGIVREVGRWMANEELDTEVELQTQGIHEW